MSQCLRCGSVELTEATAEQYAEYTAHARERNPEARTPDHLEVCDRCGAMRVTLRTTFDLR